MQDKEWWDMFEKLWCCCNDGDPVDYGDTAYVTQANIPGVGVVDHHGFVCNKCGKYVQLG